MMRLITTNKNDGWARRALPFVICALLLACIAMPRANASGEDAAQWREDLEYMKLHAPEIHKDLYHAVKKADFDAAIDRLESQAGTLTRNQMLVGVMRIVAMIGDGHTRMALGNKALDLHRYPLHFYKFPDGIYVVAGDAKYANVVGGKVTTFGSTPADVAFQKVLEIAPRDNPMSAMAETSLYLTLPEVMNGLGIAPDADHMFLTVEKDGRQITTELGSGPLIDPYPEFAMPAGWVDARDKSIPKPLWLKDPGNEYWYEYLPESHVMYVQYNSVADKKDETIAAFAKRVMAFADSHPVDKFVVDVRENGGGNNGLNWPFIYGFIRSDKVNQRGKLFTIIGRDTFSAAGNFVNAMNKHTNTLFVGEPMGYKPNSYGDNAPLTLPNSKWVVRLSTLWWQDMDPRDNRPWQAPDIAAEMTFADYVHSRDPMLDAILHYQDHGALEDRVNAALARGSLEVALAEVKKFQQDPANKYASAERALNTLGYRLMSDDRVDQAVEIFKLNAKAYPDSFNVYDSLGEAYLKQGNKQLAIENYTKTLELNGNNPAAHQALEKLKAEQAR